MIENNKDGLPEVLRRQDEVERGLQLLGTAVSVMGSEYTPTPALEAPVHPVYKQLVSDEPNKSAATAVKSVHSTQETGDNKKAQPIAKSVDASVGSDAYIDAIRGDIDRLAVETGKEVRSLPGDMPDEEGLSRGA